MTVKRILLLGGYGNFGKRIAESLAVDPSICIIISGGSGIIIATSGYGGHGILDAV